MVICFNYFLDFNVFYNDEVVVNCYRLFIIEDIFGVVEIWRY